MMDPKLILLLSCVLLYSFNDWAVDGAAGDCEARRGIEGYSVSRANGSNGYQVIYCLNKLRDGEALLNGCVTRSFGRCRCTVDSMYPVDYKGNYTRARTEMFKISRKFTAMQAEWFEKMLYLTYTCKK